MLDKLDIDIEYIELQKNKFNDIYFYYERGYYKQYGAFQELDKCFNECKHKTPEIIAIYSEIKQKIEHVLPFAIKNQIIAISKDVVANELKDFKAQNNNFLALNPNNNEACTRLLDLVFGYFPQFKKDYEALLQQKIIKTEVLKDKYGDDTLFLKWEYFKHTLALYFGNLAKERGEKAKWKNVQNLFKETRLSKSFSQGKKDTKQYNELLEYLKNYHKKNT